MNLVIPRADEECVTVRGDMAGFGGRRFPCIYADPSWRFGTRSEKGVTSRSPEAHYPTMSLPEICALQVESIAAKDALLWMWVIGPFLAAGLHVQVMKAWGFEPSSIAFVWIKTGNHVLEGRLARFDQSMFRTNMGFTTRQNAEFVVLGRRGSPERLNPNIRQILAAPWPEPIFQHQLQHSRKPAETFRRIEAYCAGPRVELNAREVRPGWSAWGNETDKFDGPLNVGAHG